jgi:hypothetical protein
LGNAFASPVEEGNRADQANAVLPLIGAAGRSDENFPSLTSPAVLTKR